MLTIVKIAFLVVLLLLIGLEVYQARIKDEYIKLARYALTLVAVANILFMIYLLINHINFPLNLDLMEGTVLQHALRAARFQPIYTQPTPEFVPLAYNPLYYWIVVPFLWLFGPGLFALRFVAILGMIGSAIIIYRIVREKTQSSWWAIIALGLFTAAYQVMNVYLDTAHSDSWLLFCALLGTYLIDKNRSFLTNLVGLLVLIASFWFKQHGAIFVLGGLIYLTWRDGIRSALIYWVLTLLGGPVVYIFVGPALFGPTFHLFTWEIPRHWTAITLDTFRHYIGFILKNYPILVGSIGYLLWTLLKDRSRINLWLVQLFSALLTGFMGSMDPGSASNVYIPMGTWFIIIGTIAIYEAQSQIKLVDRYRLGYIGIATTFVIFLYNPFSVITSPRQFQAFADLENILSNLGGNVYAPTLGQLQSGFVLYPAAHWVALEDMIRGPGKDISNNANTRNLLSPLINPSGKSYILLNYPLEIDPLLGFFTKCYALEQDYGERFEALKVLPGSYSNIQGWPRYLYHFSPEKGSCSKP